MRFAVSGVLLRFLFLPYDLSIGFSSPARYKLITPFKIAIAHTLNEETEDPKNSLNKELTVNSIHARKADTSGSRNMTLPGPEPNVCFRYQDRMCNRRNLTPQDKTHKSLRF